MASADDKSPELPPYPQLIMGAIEALDGKDGSSKTVISEYIESQHKDLPVGHSTLLAHHLNKLTESGELELVNDNYKKAVSSSPKKRGRGRPRKDPALSGTPATSPRPRGRPPKDPASRTPASSPRPRGRPPIPKPEGAPDAAPKPRGRPPKVWGESVLSKAKVKAKVKANGSAETSTKRGRPAKKAKTAAAASPGVKRGRGRPPKAKPDAPTSG